MGNTRNLGDLLNTDSTIATADVADGSITTAKLADDAVTTAKITNDAVTTAKVNPSQTDITSVGTLTGLNVTTGSSGASANSVGDELVIQSSGRGGISILTPDANESNVLFGSPSDNLGGFITYKQSTATMELGTSISNGVVKFNSGDGALGMTLNASGNLVFASNKGIDFSNASAPTDGSGNNPAETSTATLLDDYEEGTFIPISNSVDNQGAGSTIKGMYVKVGNMVTISVRFTAVSESTNGHQFGIHLPIRAGTTESSGSFNTWYGQGEFITANGNGADRVWALGGDSNYVNIKQQGASSTSEITGNSMTGTFNMNFSITYQAKS